MKLDFPHPYPRYGLAVALVDAQVDTRELHQNPEKVREWVAVAIDRALGRCFLRTLDDPSLPGVTELNFDFLAEADLNPGKKHKQDAEHGHYLAPHVSTSNNAAGAVEDARKLRDLLRSGAPLDKTFDLKRSFAPLTSKVNNGRTSMANPKASLLEAACTAVATLTEDKPGLFAGVNYVIIPDLPLLDENEEHEPLLDFVRLFADLRSTGMGGDTLIAKLPQGKKEYRRPPLFSGNFPGAPRDVSLSMLGLLAAIGGWAKRAEVFRGDPRAEYAERVLDYLSRNPLYLVSYDGTRQEHFGHHLVEFALWHELEEVLKSINRVVLHGASSFQDPKWALFRMMTARFLQFFTPATFQDFLAFRAEYPAPFFPTFEEYFMKEASIPGDLERRRELVQSARAYGASLNKAAYRAAKKEHEADEKRKVQKPRSVKENKSRILVQLESTALSARTPAALLAQLGGITGRSVTGEVAYEGGVFMEAVATEEIPLDTAKQLITAFMRLRTGPQRQRSESDVVAGAPAEDEPNGAEVDSDSTANDEMPE